MSNILKKILKTKGFIVFNLRLSNQYNKIIELITGLSNIVETGKIYYDMNKTSSISPYYSNLKLDFHNDGLGESKVNPLYLFLKCNIKAEFGGENIFIDSKKLIQIIPKHYLQLKYHFGLFNKNITIQRLFIKHPLYGYPCINFTLYGVNEFGESNIIKFIDKNEEENMEILSFLYKIINNNSFFIDLNKDESILFDNYRYLHGRNSFIGYRELERKLIYL